MYMRSILFSSLIALSVFAAARLAQAGSTASHLGALPTPAALLCAPNDRLVWVFGTTAYVQNDVRFASTPTGHFGCRSQLTAQIAVSPLDPATPAPTFPPEIISVTSAGGGVGVPASRKCDCAAVTIYYVTDRNATGDGPRGPDYGGDRKPDGSLTYGSSTVTIPRDHRMGQLERPEWFLLEFNEDPNKHVVIRATKEVPRQRFFDRVSGDASDTNGEALVFVHGYNVGFDESVMRTAQLKYDLGFSGPAITYSWPAAGKTIMYPHDENDAIWTTAHFEAFFAQLAATTGITKIHLIAHSMGNRVVTDALADEGLRGHHYPNLADVIFAAADVDQGVFVSQYARFRGIGQTKVLYASASDKALQLSEGLHGGRRAGDANPILLLSGLQSIDATAVDTSFDGHGYFASNATIVSDIFWVMHGKAPPRFRLRDVESGTQEFWRFAP